MFAQTVTEFRSGQRHDSGSVAIIFGVMAIVLFGLLGVAVDTSRATNVASRVTAALDSAALAAAKAMNSRPLTDEEVTQIAQQMFDENSKSKRDTVQYNPVTVTIDRNAGSVTVAVTAKVPTTLSRVMAFNEITVARSVTAVYKMRDIELSMMLDVSGSMRGQKIQDLRDAARDVVNILMPVDGAQKVKIGLAPYSTSVNAGSYADLVTNSQSSACVSERGGAGAFVDDAPSVQPLTGLASWCPDATIQPLTNVKSQLESQIAALDAGGWTAGHLGVAWAWYLVSPNWSNVWPAASQPVAYGDENTIKAVILMTDGRFNTTYVAGNGSSAQQAVNLCDNMKAEGVQVYAVAFQAPASAERTLQDCATSPKHYFDAQDGGELRSAFQTIALRLANLRLSK